MNKLILTLAFAIALFGAVSFGDAATTEVKMDKFTPSVPFPGLESIAICNGGECDGIARYATGVYRFLIGFVALLAVLMLVWGGIQWMISGASDGIKKAQDTIKNALIGLALALISYTLLWTINPQLVKFPSLKIKSFQALGLEVDSDPGESGDSDGSVATSFTKAHCPKSGGATEIPKIIGSLKDKVAYRFGGKGGSPPYQEKSSGSYASYNNFCPSDNICLDCSGFVNYILQCAGMKAPGGGTSTIFNSGEQITGWDIKNKTVNGTRLLPGDLIGFKAGEVHPVGHVYIYAGDGVFVQSRGGKKGRESGGNPVETPMTDAFMKQYAKHIRRIQ